MPLIMPDEQFPARPVIVMIVGTPFSFKTSLAMTSKNPIVVDGDRGADRAVGRVPIFVLSQGWAEVEEEEKNGLFTGKNTCILDTPKAIIDDYMWDRSLQLNYTANTQKIYGAVGTMFKAFVAKRRIEGMDIVVVSHEKSKDQGDMQVYEPDITGQSKQLLLRMCDQVGFMWKQEVKGPDNKMTVRTVLTFNPKPQWPFCKNVAGLPDLVLPHYTSNEWKGFMDREIIEPTKSAISAMTDEQRASLSIIEEWQEKIDAIVPAANLDVNSALTKMGKDIAEKITEEHLQKQVRNYLVNHIKKIGYKWDAKATAFVPMAQTPAGAEIVADKPKEEAPVEDKPVVVAEQGAGRLDVLVITPDDTPPQPDEIDLKAEAERQRAELNQQPAASVKQHINVPAPTGPSINPNPHLAQPKKDLFAPQND